ncbi:MAG: hypothetical protein AAGJ94_15600 [Pseudomonadota bacterium]
MFDAVNKLCPTIAFVAHAGPLEPQAALLAASLHEYYLPGRIICRTVAPTSVWGDVSADLKALLNRLNIPLMPCENPIEISYKHGNKIGALDGLEERCLFLDTDMMLMAPFSWHYMLSGAAAAKPADVDTFSNGGGSWARVWSLFDKDVPPKRYKATVSGDLMRPYFNAGFILVEHGDDFAKTWIDCARKIDADTRIRNKRPWLDQIALPVTFASLGWEVDALGDAFNYPCHIATIGDAAPYFAHYHYPHVIAEQPKLAFRFKHLLKTYTDLGPILRRYEGWDVLMTTMEAN